MHCVKLETQLKAIAIIETTVSTCLLGLNLKILIQLLLGKEENEQIINQNSTLSESAVMVYFLIRVLYLLGELLLAIYLTYNVYKRNGNGLILWFFMTIIYSIPSRCYFIGGVLWGQYFVITFLIFSVNLAFTAYSLVTICLYLKHLTTSRVVGSCACSRRGSLTTTTVHELTDTFLDDL